MAPRGPRTEPRKSALVNDLVRTSAPVSEPLRMSPPSSSRAAVTLPAPNSSETTAIASTWNESLTSKHSFRPDGQGRPSRGTAAPRGPTKEGTTSSTPPRYLPPDDLSRPVEGRPVRCEGNVIDALRGILELRFGEHAQANRSRTAKRLARDRCVKRREHRKPALRAGFRGVEAAGTAPASAEHRPDACYECSRRSLISATGSVGPRDTSPAPHPPGAVPRRPRVLSPG